MLCVIGCGNSTRSDDGVGVHVAQSLQARCRRHPRDNVRVFDAGTGGMDVMFQARGASSLIIVDASRSGSEAGAIFKLPGSELESLPEPGYSLHDFRWQHALAAGRRIFGTDFPSDVTVYLVEAKTLAFGLDLSEPVLASALRVTAEIEGMFGPRRETEDTKPSPGACEVSVSRGNVYLSREVCDTYLPDAAAVALLAREESIFIVPLTRQSGGGLLLKQRNARGDRVVHAQEFFREKGYAEDFSRQMISAYWSSESAALILPGVARPPTT